VLIVLTTPEGVPRGCCDPAARHTQLRESRDPYWEDSLDGEIADSVETRQTNAD